MGKKETLKKNTIRLVRSAIIGALYFVLTYFLAPISYGPLQFRVAEAFTLLPILFPEAIVGLSIGCLLANIFSAYGWYDMVFGTLATLIAAILTYLIGRWLREKKLVVRALIGAIPPILVNAIVLPLIWLFFSGDTMYWLNFATILATQTGTILVIGTPLVLALDKAKLSRQKILKNLDFSQVMYYNMQAMRIFGRKKRKINKYQSL